MYSIDEQRKEEKYPLFLVARLILPALILATFSLVRLTRCADMVQQRETISISRKRKGKNVAKDEKKVRAVVRDEKFQRAREKTD